MKNRVYTIVMAAALILVFADLGYAKSTLISMSMEPEWPTSSEPGTVVLYKITAVNREGQGMLEVALSCDGLPEGTVVTFTPAVLRFTGRVPETRTAMMMIKCPTLTATDTYPFTVTGTSWRETVTIMNQIPADFFGIASRRPTLMLDWLQAGTVRIRGQAASGQHYWIESSPDVAYPVWTPYTTCTADGNGRFAVEFNVNKDLPMLFFRAVYSSPIAVPAVRLSDS